MSKKRKRTWHDDLDDLGACYEARRYCARFRTLRAAWDGLDNLPRSTAVAWLWWLYCHCFVSWGQRHVLEDRVYKVFRAVPSIETIPAWNTRIQLATLKAMFPVPNSTDLRKAAIGQSPWTVI